MRGIFFDGGDARAVAEHLRRDGHDAEVVRERLAGEDDDEDHPWAVLTDAPASALEPLVDERDGWLDAREDDHGAGRSAPPPPTLPTAPRRPGR